MNKLAQQFSDIFFSKVQAQTHKFRCSWELRIIFNNICIINLEQHSSKYFNNDTKDEFFENIRFPNQDNLAMKYFDKGWFRHKT